MLVHVEMNQSTFQRNKKQYIDKENEEGKTPLYLIPVKMEIQIYSAIQWNMV